MPYYRRKRKQPVRRRKIVRRRRRYARKGATSRSSAIVRVTRAPTSPLGKIFKMSLPYVEQAIQLNPGIGGLAVSHFFSANGLYDPNVTGGGHQPLGFDQIMPLYDHYTVIASKITVTAYNDDSTVKQVIGVRLADQNSAPYTDLANLMENGGGKYVWLNSKGGNGDMVTFSMGCSPKRFFGKSLNDDTYKGGIGANPADQVFFHVWAAPYSSTDSAAINVNVRIDYIALFSEPKQLQSS